MDPHPSLWEQNGATRLGQLATEQFTAGQFNNFLSLFKIILNIIFCHSPFILSLLLHLFFNILFPHFFDIQ